MILENVSTSLRGELSRWMIEPHPGVFIGHISGMVRDLLWEKVCGQLDSGGALQAWSTNTEQRFKVRTAGVTDREIVNLEGLYFVRKKVAQTRNK